MKVVIFYEHAERELQNAYLLKVELNRRGHDVYIYNIYYLLRTKEILKFKPDIVLVPFLYSNKDVNLFKNRFLDRNVRLVNLQYEPILSQKWKNIGFHNPKETAKNEIHLCWGDNSHARLMSNGVKEENAIITGSLNVDMDMQKFESIYRTKLELSKRFKIPVSNKWILFISSFSCANIGESKKKDLYNKFGKENANEFIDISYKSKQIILQWLAQYAKENDVEIIYRPHPSENKDKYLNQIESNLNNFHVISQDSVRTWIKNCDSINTWISTSIIDSYFMNKNCNILRPVELHEDMDIEICCNAKFLITYEEFYKYNNVIKETKFPIKETKIIQYYDVDEKYYAYERICDVLEGIQNNKI